ncbi:hypothetical protein L2E82_35631 [Cichorium intybus]|uniref:Uncharacterized protein n=1 Tax=Cichorium intybus TaxID=13427 RepID=A0ACB9BPD9_CICIN|nr:hypothetical protein L2E82_35631 [Cichorium intybus]
MYEIFNATQQQSHANAIAIVNMERQIAQMAEDQRKTDNGKLPSTIEVNLTHGQRAGKEHVNTVDAEWRKVTLENLLESGNEAGSKEEEVKEEVESEKENREDKELKEIPVEKEAQPEENKDGQEEKQPTIDELKNAPEDTRILREMCEKNGKSNIPTPDTVRLTIKASEALSGTLPKKEKDPGSPLITATVGDVVIQNTLLDLGASVNVLPGYLYDKYKNEELEPAKTVLQLADQSTRVSRGKLTNVIVKVGNFFYPVDFLVMEYESQEDAPALILGHPFLATASAIIDCKTRDLDIFFGSRKRRLNMFGSPISLPLGRRKRGSFEGHKGASVVHHRQGAVAGHDGDVGSKAPTVREGCEGKRSKGDAIRNSRRIGEGTVRLAEDVKLSACWEATHLFIDCTPRDRKPTRCAGVDLGVRASRLAYNRAVGIDRSDFFNIKMSFRLDHQFLQFPKGPVSSLEYSSRRDALVGRRVLEVTIIDWDILRDAGLWGELEPFLHRTWTHGDASFTCQGWDRLMANEEDTIYTELLLEFLSTVQFAPGSADPRARLIRFRLGGVHRECNLREFGRRTGIYTEADLQHRHFTDIQRESSSRPTSPTHAPHRLHFHHTAGGGVKVSGEDMTYLWVLLDPSRFLHLPFALAVALSTRAMGASASSPLGRGYFITRLACSYRILTAPVVASLTALPLFRTTARALEKMGLIEQQRPGQFMRVATEAPQDPLPAYAQLGRRRRMQAAPADPAPPQPQQEEVTEMRRLQDRVARMEDQLEWIGEVLLELATQQGQRPRPFPARAHNHEAGSSRPPGGD